MLRELDCFQLQSHTLLCRTDQVSLYCNYVCTNNVVQYLYNVCMYYIHVCNKYIHVLPLFLYLSPSSLPFLPILLQVLLLLPLLVARLTALPFQLHGPLLRTPVGLMYIAMSSSLMTVLRETWWKCTMVVRLAT